MIVHVPGEGCISVLAFEVADTSSTLYLLTSGGSFFFVGPAYMSCFFQPCMDISASLFLLPLVAEFLNFMSFMVLKTH